MSGTRTFQMIEAVAERLEGAPRQLRRRWSEEFKAQVVAETLEPGASVSAIARRVGIHPSQLFSWRRDADRTFDLSALARAVAAGIGRPFGCAETFVSMPPITMGCGPIGL